MLYVENRRIHNAMRAAITSLIDVQERELKIARTRTPEGDAWVQHMVTAGVCAALVEAIHAALKAIEE
jgi:hypothetical protein